MNKTETSTNKYLPKVGNIDVKCELVSEQSEALVRVITVHEVETATNVGAVLALGDESEAQSVAAGGDTVGARVVGTVQAAVSGACLGVGAEGGIPLVASVAVGRAIDRVCPAPVGINSHRTSLGRARARGVACRPGHGRVSLSGQRASRLGLDGSNKGRDGRDLGVNLHVENLSTALWLLNGKGMNEKECGVIQQAKKR